MGKGSRNYTAFEDKTILDYTRKKDSIITKSEMAKDLSEKLGRTVESVRDRIKRYLSKLSNKDKSKVLNNNSKKIKEQFLFIKKIDDCLKIEKIDIYIKPIKIKKKKKILKKKVKKKNVIIRRNRNKRYGWILKRLKDKEENINLVHQKILLRDIFMNLLDDKIITLNQIINLCSKNKNELNLNDIMSHFKIEQRLFD